MKKNALSWSSNPHEIFWRTRSCSIPCDICPSFLLQDLRPPLQFEVIACTAHHPLILMLILYLKQSLGGRWRQQQNVGLSMFQLLFALPNICTKDVLSEAEPHRSVRSNRLAWVDIWSSIENHIKCTFQFVNFDGCVVNLWSKRKSSCCGCQFDSCCCLKSSGPVMYTKCLVDSGMPISIAAQELLYPVPWTWSHEVNPCFKGKDFKPVTLICKRDSRQPFCLASAFKLGNFEAFHFVPNPDAIDFSRFPNCLMFQFGYTCSGLEGYVPRTEGKRSNKEDTTKPRNSQLATRNSLWGQASQSLQEVGNRLESIRFEVEQLDSTPIFVLSGICLAKPLSWRVHRTDFPPSPER